MCVITAVLPALGLVQLLLVIQMTSRAAAMRGSLPKECEQYAPLYESITRDLSIYKQAGGITPNLLYRTMVLHSASYREKGLAAAFYNGRAYIISHSRRINLHRFGHHVALWVAYIRVLQDLEARFGPSLPNVEFVWHTIDRPVRLTNTTATATATTAAGGDGGGGDNGGAGEEGWGEGGVEAGGLNFPVFRFCKSDSHPDILMPIYHFNMKRYQSTYLDRMNAFNTEHPWRRRSQVAFARFTGYNRYVHPDDPHTQRLGLNGRSICRVEGRTTAICPVRSYLAEWARNYTGVMDIHINRQVPMEEHADYRYLLHVDGQGLSSKLEVLLTLGSLVLKEESGYRAFFHHLLRPYEHYVPVWKPGSGPQDILEAVSWARENDDEARRIAAAGQAFAARYLSTEARTCFWLKLLHSYAETMTYDPVQFRDIRPAEVPPGLRAVELTGTWRYIKPVQRFLDEEVATYYPEVLQELVWEA